MPFLPSTQEQLASFRDAADGGPVLVHIDTCLSSYLQDHHNREGECLFGVYVDGNSTAYDVLQGLLDEMRQTGDRVPDPITDDDMKACAKSWFADAFGTSPERLSIPFDSSLDVPDDDGDDDGTESCQAWFVLTWEAGE